MTKKNQKNQKHTRNVSIDIAGLNLPTKVWSGHRKRTILLSRKRVNEGTRQKKIFPFPSFVFSYATEQGIPLATSPAEHAALN